MLHKHQNQSGQSIIETIAAIFILTMGLTSALGLAIYALSHSAISQNEVIATNLAREGIDVVRAMRDSNWLAGDAKDPDGSKQWGLQACSDIGDRLCFPKSYDKVPSYNQYDINGPTASNPSGNYRAIITTNNSGLADIGLDSTANYNLYLQPNFTYSVNPNGTSVYARMINISFNSNPPFTNQNSNQELIIKSVVAWRGKNCTDFDANQNLLTLVTACKVVTEEHLTNWKDYK